MMTKTVTKFIVATALTLAMLLGSGIIAEELGLDSVPTAHASQCSSSAGGGC